jgi:hypothetical protein
MMVFALWVGHLVLFLHFAFVVFVVGMIPLLLIGLEQNWLWIYDPTLRYLHLLLQGIVGVEVLCRWPCPFTWLENICRSKAGRPLYTNGFVDYWSQKFFSMPINAMAFNGVCLVIFFSSLWLWIQIPPV